MRGPAPASAPADRDPLLRPRAGFFFEKWYFDALAADGRFLFGYFAPVTLLGHRSAELVVCLCQPGAVPLERSFHLEPGSFELDADRLALRFDGGGLELRGDHCRVELQRGDVQLVLDYARRDPPWRPLGDARLWQHGNRALTWSVPLPNARASVRGHLGASDLTLDGDGYADFVQTDLLPWRVPLRTLLWGRALGPDTTLIWERLRFAPRSRVQVLGLVYLRHGAAPAVERTIARCEAGAWSAGQDGRGQYPSRLRFELGEAALEGTLEVEDTAPLLEATVTDLQSFGSRLRQAALRRMTGDPQTYKLLSRARLAPAGLDLRAAHEWVLWGRGAHRGGRATQPSPSNFL